MQLAFNKIQNRNKIELNVKPKLLEYSRNPMGI